MLDLTYIFHKNYCFLDLVYFINVKVFHLALVYVLFINVKVFHLALVYVLYLESSTAISMKP